MACSGGGGEIAVSQTAEPVQTSTTNLSPCTVFTVTPADTWDLYSPCPWGTGTFTGTSLDVGLNFFSSDNSSGYADLSVDIDGSRVWGVTWGNTIGGTVSGLAYGTHSLTATSYEVYSEKSFTFTQPFTLVEPAGGGGGGGGCERTKKGCP